MEYIVSNMETDRLRHFKTIVDAGGLLKASELLSITGGGLSKSIKTLEHELNQKLFIQKGRGLELTEFGHELYQKLPQALEVLESLKGAKAHLKTFKKPIRIASFEVFTTYFLGNFLAVNELDHNFEIREAIPGKMEKLISEGHCDIGLTYEPIPYQGVEFLKASKITMGIYTTSNAKFRSLALQEIPFVVPINPIEGTPSGVKGLDGWPEHEISRKATYRVDMMQTALQLASNGRAACFIPTFVATQFNAQVQKKYQLKEIKSKELKSITRDVYIIIRQNELEGSFSKKLARALRALD